MDAVFGEGLTCVYRSVDFLTLVLTEELDEEEEEEREEESERQYLQRRGLPSGYMSIGASKVTDKSSGLLGWLRPSWRRLRGQPEDGAPSQDST